MDNLFDDIRDEVLDISLSIKKANPDFSVNEIVRLTLSSYFTESSALAGDSDDDLEKATKHMIGDIVKWGNDTWRKLSNNKWVKLPKKVMQKLQTQKKMKEDIATFKEKKTIGARKLDAASKDTKETKGSKKEK